MTDSPPDVKRGIGQSTLPDASSLVGQTSIPDYTTIDVGTHNTTLTIPVYEDNVAGKSSLPDYTTIICFVLLCIYV